MATKAAEIQPRHDRSAIEVNQLEQRLYEHNRQAIEQDDVRTLAFIAADKRGVQIGAIAGYSWAGMAEIKQLWVDEDHRGFGIGRALLEAAMTDWPPDHTHVVLRHQLA
ncbi:MAG TPA: GNAT family N-acetyltransferase [Ktedonobacterales bacterium]|nr:GNAT family N-acetyltransferase [Ktedonobacterales bacterium]